MAILEDYLYGNDHKARVAGGWLHVTIGNTTVVYAKPDEETRTVAVCHGTMWGTWKHVVRVLTKDNTFKVRGIKFKVHGKHLDTYNYGHRR